MNFRNTTLNLYKFFQASIAYTRNYLQQKIPFDKSVDNLSHNQFPCKTTSLPIVSIPTLQAANKFYAKLNNDVDTCLEQETNSKHTLDLQSLEPFFFNNIPDRTINTDNDLPNQVMPPISPPSLPKPDFKRRGSYSIDEGNWLAYNDYHIHEELFNKYGIVAFKQHSDVEIEDQSDDFKNDSLSKTEENTDDNNLTPIVVTGNSFSISSRIMLFSTLTNDSLKSNKKNIYLHNILQNMGTATHHKEESTYSTLSLCNTKRREECFLPFSFQTETHETLGFYLYSWLAKNVKNLELSGFEQFVTAGCMFGASLKGIDQYGATIELIKHDRKFHATQIIQKIDYNSKTPNPYEEMLFAETSKLALLINRLTKKGQKAKLYYHLPYYDYMLFGIKLYISKNITLNALSQFFKAICQKKNTYVKKISHICSNNNIELVIESPFDNLFGTTLDMYTKDMTEDILKKLNFTNASPEIINMHSKDEQVEPTREDIERTLVQECLNKLKENKFKENHQVIWRDFIVDKGVANIKTLEDLFKLANASMIAIAAKNNKDYETCSLLPLSEKQIQLGYTNHCKHSNKKYPEVFNANFLDPIISYDHISKGLLFYFGHCQNSLTDLINNKHILTHAHANIAKQDLQQKPSIELKDILLLQAQEDNACKSPRA